MKNKYTCPCCGYMVFDEGPGSFEICPICYWEDEAKQLRYPLETGANQVSLFEAQINYEKNGVSDLRLKELVRPVNESDKRDPKWHKIDLKKDKVTSKKEEKKDINIYPTDLTKLYYWEDCFLVEE